ncbi:hypothetical protein TSUD_297550 [Trifolium subterraneum]|uniref:Uncharacterized protein n=1 Tax=Trifolium subterraneum TaxID=3900 RepID=A0A2Z6MI07_TRISU|nr:hypothetical protein TSUD_297550 [Trifolium subterraneum]
MSSSPFFFHNNFVSLPLPSSSSLTTFFAIFFVANHRESRRQFVNHRESRRCLSDCRVSRCYVSDRREILHSIADHCILRRCAAGHRDKEPSKLMVGWGEIRGDAAR